MTDEPPEQVSEIAHGLLHRLQSFYQGDRRALMVTASTIWSMAFASAYADKPERETVLAAALAEMRRVTLITLGVADAEQPVEGKAFDLSVPDFQRFNTYANSIGMRARVERIDPEHGQGERRIHGVWEKAT